MFKSLFQKIIKKPVKLIYYASLKRIIADDLPVYDKNVLVGENCSINSSALLICNGSGTINFEGSNYVGRNTELQPSLNGGIKIGFGTSIQDRNIILGDVEIGKYCLTAPNVYMSSGRHYFDLDPNFYIRDQDAMVSNSEILSSQHSKKIVIEDDVWIGINSVIMSGVTISRGSIIGSNSVVTSNVPPFSIMAGSPAKLIKKRLDFIPKTILKFDNDNDLPNFYKGFFINVKNLQIDRADGGIAASNSFAAYLENTGSKVQLILKKMTEEPIILNYNNQDILLSETTFESISFNLDNQNYHQFSVKLKNAHSTKKYLLIKEIKVLA